MPNHIVDVARACLGGTEAGTRTYGICDTSSDPHAFSSPYGVTLSTASSSHTVPLDLP
jgi:hypothetical protein